MQGDTEAKMPKGQLSLIKYNNHKELAVVKDNVSTTPSYTTLCGAPNKQMIINALQCQHDVDVHPVASVKYTKKNPIRNTGQNLSRSIKYNATNNVNPFYLPIS